MTKHDEILFPGPRGAYRFQIFEGLLANPVELFSLFDTRGKGLVSKVNDDDIFLVLSSFASFWVVESTVAA